MNATTTDILTQIRKPIDGEMQQFSSLLTEALTHDDGLLGQALAYIRQRTGKQMRPMLILLMAKNFAGIYGEKGVDSTEVSTSDCGGAEASMSDCCGASVNESTLRAGVGLELLHTASLVHDDVVDESDQRRGQRSMNAVYDNKVAVLVGDYILSTALLNMSMTRNCDIVAYLSQLGQTLANGEILQLTSNGSEQISEEAYYNVIKQKTAALFEACCAMGAMSVGAPREVVDAARLFGQNLGIIFQIRDDIFDYNDNAEIGKPTHNDMVEGKLTLPAIHALLAHGAPEMLAAAQRVKQREASREDIDALAAFAKANGGIEYAERTMDSYRTKCLAFIDEYVNDASLREALIAYVNYVIGRTL